MDAGAFPAFLTSRKANKQRRSLMNPEVKVMVKYFSLVVDGKEFKFNSAGHCEQVLRGFVHSGFTVTIKEVSEIRIVTSDEIDQYNTEGTNFRYFNDGPKTALSRNEDCCEEQTRAPAVACR
jgi:hypothetical protein